MQLAKPFLDVGMFCADIAASRQFWQESLGLPYEELLKVGGGVHQHRLGLFGAVLKLNTSRDPLVGDLPTCFRGLEIASRDVSEAAQLEDPDGTPVTLIPAGSSADAIEILWASRSPQRLGELLFSGLDAVPAGGDRWRVGDTTLRLVADPDASHAPGRGAGLRYLTVQVHDVVAEHSRLLEVGWSEDTPPMRLGEVAAISMVRDPDGALLEVSQRASLTGPLPRP